MTSSSNNMSEFSVLVSTDGGSTFSRKTGLGFTSSYSSAMKYFRYVSWAKIGNIVYFHQQLTGEYIDDSMSLFGVALGTGTASTITMTTSNAPTCIGAHNNKFIKCFSDMVAISNTVS